MSSMTALAEDLLKTRTIPELRERVSQLEKEANSKKTELQHMVGSKYHDFIQSADKINEMRSQALEVDQQIAKLWKNNQDLVVMGHNLLIQTLPQNARTRKVVERSTVVADLTLTNLWKDLDDCNVFRCGVNLITAHLLLSGTPTIQYVSPKSRGAIESLVFTKHQKCDLRNVANLAVTVLRDCELILLEDESVDSSDSEVRARALAAYSVARHLSGAKANSNLLDVYLESADVRIMELFAGDLRTSHSSSSHGSVGALTAAHTTDISQLSKGLSRLVAVLQEIVMDVHLLFFVDVAPEAGSSDKPLSGLVDFYQDGIVREAVHKLQVHCTESNVGDKLEVEVSEFVSDLHCGRTTEASRTRANEWLSALLVKITNRCKDILSGLTNASDVAMLQQRVWRSCTTLSRASSKAQHAYSQILWETACRDFLIPANELLHPSHSKRKLRKHTSTPKASSGSGSNVLYATVFRVSFMHQVERLLFTSCADILVSVKRTILHALASEGLKLDGHSLSVKAVAGSPEQAAERLCSARIFNIAEFIKREFEHLLSTLYLNSSGSHLLSGAKEEDSVGSSSLDDPHSAATLAKALQWHCSQLIGQLLILLRTIGENCRDSLITRGLLLSNAEWNALFLSVKDAKSGSQALLPKDLQALLKTYCTNPEMSIAQSNASSAESFRLDKSSGGVAGYSADGDATPLLSALLLIGRLAWVFKTRGSFLESSLRPCGAGVSSGDGVLCQNSEDQFRSAFEIADTNGDGIISYSESQEAILALTNSDGGSPSTAAFPGMSSSLTPTLTFSEFSLLAGGQLIVLAEQNPVKQLRSCLDYLVSSTHTLFAVFVTVAETKNFGEQLASNLALDCMNKPNVVFKDVERLFKISWTAKSVAGDLDDTMQVPAGCSSSLAAAITGVNNRISASCVSIDTMQREIATLSHPVLDSLTVGSIASEDVSDLLEESCSGAHVLAYLSGQTSSPDVAPLQDTSPMLAQLVSRVAHQLTLALVYRAYNSQLQLLKTRVAGGLGGAGLDSLLEDVSLQVVFDLTFLNRASASLLSAPGAAPSSGGLLSVLLSQWRGYLDSVTAELVLPMLEESVKEYSVRMNLLVPAQGAKAKTGSTVSTSQSSSDQILSRIFPSVAPGSAQVSRFALLPLALMTASTPVTPSPVKAVAPKNSNVFAGHARGPSGGSGPLVSAAVAAEKIAPNSGKSAAPGGGIKWW